MSGCWNPKLPPEARPFFGGPRTPSDGRILEALKWEGKAACDFLHWECQKMCWDTHLTLREFHVLMFSGGVLFITDMRGVNWWVKWLNLHLFLWCWYGGHDNLANPVTGQSYEQTITTILVFSTLIWRAKSWGCVHHCCWGEHVPNHFFNPTNLTIWKHHMFIPHHRTYYFKHLRSSDYTVGILQWNGMNKS